MATTITYKGSVIATATNTTKTLNTQGKYMEGNVIISDVSASDSDFVVRLNYNTQTNQWEPQCTFAEIQAANAADKIIGVLAEDSAGNYMAQAYGQYVDLDDDQYFEYITDTYNSTGDGVVEEGYAFRSTGITFNGSTEYELPKTLGTKTIIANGTYNAWNNDYVNGYSEVTVNINPRLQTKSVQPSETEQVITPDLKAASVGTINCNVIQSGSVYVYTDYDLPMVKDKIYHVISNSDAYVATANSSYSINVDATFTYSFENILTFTGTTGITNIITRISLEDYGPGATKVRIWYTKGQTIINGNLILTIYEDYDGLSQVTIAAVPSSYVGSDIPRKSSSDLTASGSIVTVPAGYYSANASKAIPNASQALTDAYVQSSGDLEVELNTSSGGYVANGNQYLQFENFTTPVPTTTYYATSSDQVIMSQNSMAFGAQTIKGVTYSGLDASNIKKDVVVKIGDSSDDDRILSITGTYEGGGGGDTPEATPKDVNFIDYDGKCLYSYTAQEFASLSALPANPSHDGLTAQGWNWTLADAQAQVASSGHLVIGQVYIPTDGKTHIIAVFPPYIPAARRKMRLRLGQTTSNGVDIDWGDGTVQTISSKNITDYTHSYDNPGEYDVTINVRSGSLTFNTTNNYNLFGVCGSNADALWNTLRGVVRAIFFGNGVINLGTYTLFGMQALRAITLPNGVTSGTQYNFYNLPGLTALVLPPTFNGLLRNYIVTQCYSLRYLSLPKTVDSFGNNVFGQTYALNVIDVPTAVTTIGNQAFYRANALTKLTIPSGVTSIGSNAFYQCYALKELHMKPTSPPTLGANAWSGVASDLTIYVPYSEDHSILNAYKTATNWSGQASKMTEESV